MEDYSVNGFDGNGPMDTFVNKFYEKLSEIYTTWIPLENQYYKNIELGDLEFGKVKEMNKWPDLTFFNVAIAKNGGPIGKQPSLVL